MVIFPSSLFFCSEMTVYEPSKTPTPGMFIRNRTNAISVRSRRSRGKVLDQNENEINSHEEVSKNSGNSQSQSQNSSGALSSNCKQQQSSQISRPRSRSRYSSEFDQSANLQSKSEEILMPSHRRYCNSESEDKRLHSVAIHKVMHL